MRDPDAEEGPSEAGRGAGALARVQRQRSRADASVLVSQPQAARKRQKREEAAEARRVGGQLVFADRLPLSPVKNSVLKAKLLSAH